jgi:hypothetical protein
VNLGESFGFCSQSCQSVCPDFPGEAPTMCVSLDGRGQCVSRADANNAFCSDIPGTSMHVMPRLSDGDYQAVCGPPHIGTFCNVEGLTGECIDANLMTCNGLLNFGACPGGSNILCCT